MKTTIDKLTRFNSQCAFAGLQESTRHISCLVLFKPCKICVPLCLLGNRIDKLFGYQSYLQATLAKRPNTHRLGVISPSYLPIVWRFRLAERLKLASYACFILAFLPIVWRNKTLAALPLGGLMGLTRRRK